ncbi:hypothetical protein [Actinotalea sp. JY-7876]|uniref:hypothetical protein n=1 Tax=Actinotalea sp. JY-7876 TaxID=2758442 RepID=UPI0015F4D2BD|nr:hypothetical protein [Actinotalea sp. JY-7876]
MSHNDELDCWYYSADTTPESASGSEGTSAHTTEPEPRLFGSLPTNAPPSDDTPLPPAVQTWECWCEATIDYDWHNDVMCSDGTHFDRPYLLADDSFVTEAELMQAAADYESWLNGG